MTIEIFNRPVAGLYKTAKLNATGKYVALTHFIRASPEFGHGDFYWIRTIEGDHFSVNPDELTSFCL